MFYFYVRALAVAVFTLVAATGCSASKGSAGTASFSYDHGLVTLSHPLAVGGSASLFVTVQTGAGVASVVATPSTMVTVGPLTVEGSGAAASASIQGLEVGVATVTAYDASGGELGSAAIQVSPAAIVSVLAESGLTVLEGGQYAAPVTAADAAGVVLAGSSFQVAYSGAIASAQISWATDSPISFGTVSTGAGEATITVPSASASLAIQVVSASDLDALSFPSGSQSIQASGSAFAEYTLTSRGVTVYSDGRELVCTSSNPAVATPATAVSGGLQGGAQTGQLTVQGLSSGSATFTCRVGSLVASFDVTVQ